MRPDRPNIPRITWKSLAEHILEQLNLERGLGYTVKALLLKPRHALREYLFEDRHRMVKPLGFLLLVVAIAAYMSTFILPFDSDIGQMLEKDAVFMSWPEEIRNLFIRFFELSRQYVNLFLMSSIPATTLATFFVFKDRGLNFPEHLVINVYIFAIQTLLILPFLPIMAKVPALSFMVLVINLGYFYYALTKIFQLSWGEGALKTFIVFLIGQVVQGLLVGIVLGLIALVTYLV